jgi:hypothetical protein
MRRALVPRRRDSSHPQRLAALEWDKPNPVRPKPDEFTLEILPRLNEVSYSALSRASALVAGTAN